MNEKFQNSLAQVAQDCPPIWMMRQAGRYHDHYQNLKKKYTFKDLCTNPELAAQTALGPIEDFDFDVSIYFNDILYPLEALGFNLEYNPGPKLSPSLTIDFFDQLKSTQEANEFLSFQKNAVAATRELLPKDKSLIGFIGGPWTLFTYAMECSHKGHMITSKTQSELFNRFCEHLLPVLDQCITDQLSSGAEIVMIFDTSAGSLSGDYFNKFVVPTIKKLSDSHPNKVGYYAKETTSHQLNSLKACQLAGLGFDHRYNMENVLQNKTHSGFTQGNFDQTLLFSDPSRFEKVLKDYLAPIAELSNEDRRGWVCGLGHGVLPKTPQENVRNFVKIVREVFNA